MKKKSLFFTVILICSLGLLGCGGGGDDSDTSPEPYVSFTVVGYSSGGEWTGGVSYPGFGSVPECSLDTSVNELNGAGLKVSTATFGYDTTDHVYITTDGVVEKTYISSDCQVQIRLLGQNGNNSFQLTSETVTITHADSDYVEGTFTGLDFSGNTVSGSFLFNRLADNTWWD